jgi:hypothetical protein
MTIEFLHPTRFCVSRQLLPPRAPTGVRVTTLGHSIRVSWKPVPDAIRYEIWRRSPDLRRIGTTARTSFLDRTPPQGRMLTYSVRGVNGAGPGAFSKLVRSSRP